MTTLSSIDITIFCLYAVVLMTVALWVSREKEGHEKNAEDYFLAGKMLPWWAIGASLIAANISAEQIIGMSGSGFAMGLAIASYEWMAAITLILVGKFLLPVYRKHNINTMPEFLEKRYDHRVRVIMATFWLGVYVFVNLTSILWLGALAISTVAGIPLVFGMLFLGIFAGAYSLYGGLKAVAFTDIIQVVLLIIGGLLLAHIALNELSGGQGILAGFGILQERVPEKFDMIFSSDSPHYANLPGLSVLLGGMWVMNLSYWGFNQYIIQRALAAKSLREAQKGIVFASFLKLLMPAIVVLPGIIAVVLTPTLQSPDQAYPAMMTMMPVGLKGLIFAALVAAILSSLASMSNSISTIFTLDLYASFRPKQTQRHYVFIGRLTSFTALAVAMLTARPLLGNFDQAFQYIQEFTGFFTPGIVVIFLLGIFWKKTTADAALTAAVASAVLSFILKLAWPELPFIDRVGLVFLVCALLAVVISVLQLQPAAETGKAVDLSGIDFSTTRGFNMASVGVVLVLVGFYTTWW